MLHEEVDFSGAQTQHSEDESNRVVKDDTFEMLRPYFREIGPVETLTAEEEVALAKRVDAHTAGLQREIFGIPFAARFVVERWSELRSAERVTATMSAVATGLRSIRGSVVTVSPARACFPQTVAIIVPKERSRAGEPSSGRTTDRPAGWESS